MAYVTIYPTVAGLNFSNGSIATLWSFGDTLTGGMVSPLFLGFTFVTMFAVMAPTSFKEHAFTSSAFVTTMIALLMVGAGVLHPFWLLAMVMVLVGGLYISARYNAQ